MSFRDAGRVSYGAVRDTGLVDVAPIAADAGVSLKGALSRNSLGLIADWAETREVDKRLDDIELLPVIPDPEKVTVDEVGDPPTLELTTRLNDAVVQSATTDDLIFSIPALVEHCSTFAELNPGDVIITGTTGGDQVDDSGCK